MSVLDLAGVNFEKGNGLVVVVTQDAQSGAVLMVAFADREALERTIATGEMHYRSRSRGLWHKGATSGNVQHVVSLTPDCDGDAVLARVRLAGPACHTGSVSCFGEVGLAADALGALDATIGRRVQSAQLAAGGRGAPPQLHDTPSADVDHHRSPAGGVTPTPSPAAAPSPAASAISSPTASPPKPSYTARLLADRNLRLKKLGEEAAELVLACADDDSARAAEEGADIVYHTLVALRAVGVTLDDVRRVLAARARPSDS